MLPNISHLSVIFFFYIFWLNKVNILISKSRKPLVSFLSDLHTTSRDILSGSHYQNECFLLRWPLAVSNYYIRFKRPLREINFCAWISWKPYECEAFVKILGFKYKQIHENNPKLGLENIKELRGQSLLFGVLRPHSTNFPSSNVSYLLSIHLISLWEGTKKNQRKVKKWPYLNNRLTRVINKFLTTHSAQKKMEEYLVKISIKMYIVHGRCLSSEICRLCRFTIFPEKKEVIRV